VVTRLVALGIPLTWAVGALLARPLLRLSWGAAVMLGAILVVSGPTVVAPLLAFVRPSERVQRILMWEGSLVDPVGATLGALVFAAVASGTRPGAGRDLLEFLVHLGTGALGAGIGLVALWFVLVRLAVGEVLGTACRVAVVVGIAAACDAVRDDTGLIAAILLGLLVGNLRRFDVPDRRPFLETLVNLLLGVLFISIAATVTPASLGPVVVPALGLIAT
jgi:NhaP-type Na+/H+ or K+/H+ antiporter